MRKNLQHITLKSEDRSPKATSYLKVFDQTKGEILQKAKADPKINTTEVVKWLTRARNLWQDRSDNNVWEVLNPWPIR